MTFGYDQGLGGDARREADQAAKELTHGVDLRSRPGLARLRLGYRYWILGVLVLFLGAHLASGFYVVGARGRVAVQERVKAKTQELLDRRHSGIRIVSASIMTITLDRSVVQAFQDVADAMADREKVINEARAYASNLIPKARGEARTRLSEAEAYKQQRVAAAIGETSRFLALQKEYEKEPDVTRIRLYLEAMEKILPKLQLYIIDSDKGRVPLHLRVTGP